MNSKLDPTRKGIYLVNDIADKEAFAYCTGTIWDKNDPKCKGELRYKFPMPGSNNKIIDCTNSKHGKGHLMHQAQGSASKSIILDAGDHLVCLANGAYAAGEEMTFLNNFR